ncbi:MAG TPA: D-Ala-D-Ala carboxypeptidase family metallohydrolase [Anaerolineales bacterium]|nr:D-Ala-D-Ala carboxypeptidase family metallohydrolase [Anaerolineales bacterium]
MKHFTYDEMACDHCGGGKLHPGFGEELDALREEFGQPMAVTSFCRCKVHNTNINGHEKSLHVFDFPAHANLGQKGTLAVDIAAVDGAYRGKLFAIAWRRGWSIGWNAKRGFLHLDQRSMIGLPQTSFDY